MTRLTVHLEEPIFTEVTQVNVGTKENVVLKPKKNRCIQNTLSFKDISSDNIISFESDLPSDIKTLINTIKKHV